MRPALVSKHERVFKEYRQTLPGELELMPEWVDEAVAKHPDVVFRPDSRQFLLVNLVELVVKPLALASSDSLTTYRLDADLSSLVRRILAIVVADASTRPDEKGEVSGHQVLVSVCNTWDEIKSEARDTWG